MKFDYRKLRGKIREVCFTQDLFATKMGIGRTSLSQRLNNSIEFSQSEILKACSLLGIKEDEIPIYFFCPDSSETRTQGRK